MAPQEKKNKKQTFEYLNPIHIYSLTNYVAILMYYVHYKTQIKKQE